MPSQKRRSRALAFAAVTALALLACLHSGDAAEPLREDGKKWVNKHTYRTVLDFVTMQPEAAESTPPPPPPPLTRQAAHAELQAQQRDQAQAALSQAQQRAQAAHWQAQKQALDVQEQQARAQQEQARSQEQARAQEQARVVQARAQANPASALRPLGAGDCPAECTHVAWQRRVAPCIGHKALQHGLRAADLKHSRACPKSMLQPLPHARAVGPWPTARPRARNAHQPRSAHAGHACMRSVSLTAQRFRAVPAGWRCVHAVADMVGDSAEEPAHTSTGGEHDALFFTKPGQVQQAVSKLYASVHAK